MKKRILALVMSVCMLISMMPVSVIAADHVHDDTCGYVEARECDHIHHPDCGYAEAVEGAECGHSCADGTCAYAEAVAEQECKHAHEDCSYVAAVEGQTCGHTHGDCAYIEAVPGSSCNHAHNDSCGYAEAVPGTACVYECASDGCTSNGDGSYTCLHTHDENCGYSEGTPGSECSHTCTSGGDCGYVAGVEGASCDHICENNGSCGYIAAVAGVDCDHSHNDACGYAPAKEAVPCDHACVSGGACGFVQAIPASDCLHHCGDGTCSYTEGSECTYVDEPGHTHTYGEWKSLGNGTHYRKCSVAECTVSETENCSGGSATCKYQAICNVCQAYYGETDPNSHQSQQTVPIDDAYHHIVCSNDECGYVFTDSVPHDFSNWHQEEGSGVEYSYCACGKRAERTVHTHIYTAATCATLATCSDPDCGETTGELDKSNHAGGTETRNAKDAAEFEPGYTGDTYCLGCGDLLSSGSAIPATHTHIYTAVVTPPACTEQGYTTYTCSCNDSYAADYVNALGHDWDGKGGTGKEAGWTFNGDGTHTRVCKRDSAHTESGNCEGSQWTIDEEKHIKHWHCNICTGGTDKAHSAGENIEHVYDNSTDLTCDICGYTRSVAGGLSITGSMPEATVGEAYSASFSHTGTVTGVVFWNAAGLPNGLSISTGSGVVSGTPTAAGSFSVTISMGATGGGSASASFTLTVNPPHTHSYTAVVTAPACTEQGYTTYTCSCNDSYVDDYVIALGHAWGEWISNGDGTHTRTCTADASHTETANCAVYTYVQADEHNHNILCECFSGEDYSVLGTEAHTMSEWFPDGDGERRECTKYCDYFENREHTHEWGSWTSNGDGTHTRTCTADASHTETANCAVYTYVQVDEHNHNILCECFSGEDSSVLGTEAHTMSEWFSDGDGERRECTAGCDYYENREHTHEWGDYSSNGNGSHSRRCTADGCDAKQSESCSGTATCHELASCSVCDASHGTYDENNHSGGTEVRGARNAAKTENGYTGDTYCLGCGALLSYGKTIPAPVAIYQIYASSGEHGSVSNEGKTVYVEEGHDMTFSFYPDIGYEVSAVWVDGVLVADNSLNDEHRKSCEGCDECFFGWQKDYHFRNVNADHTLKVEFAPVPADAFPDYWDRNVDVWYREDIGFAGEKEGIEFVSGRYFDPNGAFNLAQVITMLKRMAGSPELVELPPLDDGFSAVYSSGDAATVVELPSGIEATDDMKLFVGITDATLAPVDHLAGREVNTEYLDINDVDITIIENSVYTHPDGTEYRIGEIISINGEEYVISNWVGTGDHLSLTRVSDGTSCTYNAVTNELDFSSLTETPGEYPFERVNIGGVTYDVALHFENNDGSRRTTYLYYKGIPVGKKRSSDYYFCKGYDPAALKAQQDNYLGRITADDTAAADLTPGTTYDVFGVGANDISVSGYDDALYDYVMGNTAIDERAKAELEQAKADMEAKWKIFASAEAEDRTDAGWNWFKAKVAYEDALAALMDDQKATVAQIFEVPAEFVNNPNVEFAAVHVGRPVAVSKAPVSVPQREAWDAAIDTSIRIFDDSEANALAVQYAAKRGIVGSYEYFSRYDWVDWGDRGQTYLSEDGKTVLATYTVDGFSPFIVYALVEADEPEIKTITIAAE